MVTARRGFTLIELIVAVAIVGIMAGVAGLAFSRAAPVRSVNDTAAQVAAARSDALRLRRPVSVAVRIDGRVHRVTALPDGRVVGDSALGGHRLTGGFGDAE